ncbi:MAG: DUF2127 domain-containing protein [Betaproteobacteria bacterium]|nr:DUF2127 domain-containing protein [Betaproteobacteria bacterium]
MGAAAYCGIRLAEAYGLWYAKAWAEWLAALSGAIYLPIELFELYQGATWLGLAVLLLNVLVVAIMLLAVRSRATGWDGRRLFRPAPEPP